MPSNAQRALSQARRHHVRQQTEIFLLEDNKVILKWRMFLEFVNEKVLMTLKS